jgi:hypothetical protein
MELAAVVARLENKPAKGGTAMTCQEVSFAENMCRIEIEEGNQVPRYTAHFSVIDEAGGRIRPMVFGDGRRAEIHATSESLALTSAMTYLATLFGPPAESQHACVVSVRPGQPFVIGE